MKRMTYGQAYATISRAGADKTCCECGVVIKQRRLYVRAKSCQMPGLHFCLDCEPFGDDE
jgi:RNA polymerase-binding transcription factor DksA